MVLRYRSPRFKDPRAWVYSGSSGQNHTKRRKTRLNFIIYREMLIREEGATMADKNDTIEQAYPKPSPPTPDSEGHASPLRWDLTSNLAISSKSAVKSAPRPPFTGAAGPKAKMDIIWTVSSQNAGVSLGDRVTVRKVKPDLHETHHLARHGKQAEGQVRTRHRRVRQAGRQASGRGRRPHLHPRHDPLRRGLAFGWWSNRPHGHRCGTDTEIVIKDEAVAEEALGNPRASPTKTPAVSVSNFRKCVR